MDQETLKWLEKFVSAVGIPGGLLVMMFWAGLKHFPKLLEIFERQAVGIEGIREVQKEVREDLRDIKSAVISRTPDHR